MHTTQVPQKAPVKSDANKYIIKTESGDIDLSPSNIKKYFVSGKNADIVTDQEIVMFQALCKGEGLNPFRKEAYLIKYSTEVPAQIVTGKDVFTKRAAKCKDCAGWKAGIIVKTENGAIEKRVGTFHMQTEKLLGGWAEVYRHGWDAAMEHSVPLHEYQKTTKDGRPTGTWKEMPATMIRKVALVQALREAFPHDVQGLYAEEEFGRAGTATIYDQASGSDKTKTESILGKLSPASKPQAQTEPVVEGAEVVKKEEKSGNILDKLNGGSNDGSSS